MPSVRHHWSEPGEVKPQDGSGHSITQVCQRCYTERETHAATEGRIDPLAATHRYPGATSRQVERAMTDGATEKQYIHNRF